VGGASFPDNKVCYDFQSSTHGDVSVVVPCDDAAKSSDPAPLRQQAASMPAASPPSDIVESLPAIGLLVRAVRALEHEGQSANPSLNNWAPTNEAQARRLAEDVAKDVIALSAGGLGRATKVAQAYYPAFEKAVVEGVGELLNPAAAEQFAAVLRPALQEAAAIGEPPLDCAIRIAAQNTSKLRYREAKGIYSILVSMRHLDEVLGPSPGLVWALTNGPVNWAKTLWRATWLTGGASAIQHLLPGQSSAASAPTHESRKSAAP